MAESALSEDLALLLLRFPEWIEQGAYWLLLGFVLLAGFALAWLMQASRRRKLVFRLWDAHQRQQQEQLEECRLLAEDQAAEQASRLAYQARRIEQLKAIIARQQTPPSDGQGNAVAMPCLPAPAHATAHRTTASATGTPRRTLTMPPHPTTAAPSMKAQASTDQAEVEARIRESVHTMMKQRLARELALSRERARLLRRWEDECTYWRQACEQSHTNCDRLQAAVTALENALHDTRLTWAAAEREVKRLRGELLQQHAKAPAPLVDMATAHNHAGWPTRSEAAREEKQRLFSQRIRDHRIAMTRKRIKALMKDTHVNHPS
ncbi:MAG: hypothetical protein Q4D91_04535 [Lautropia sp.]|nr:hypothetical protein [Lautropia sp.]